MYLIEEEKKHKRRKWVCALNEETKEQTRKNNASKIGGSDTMISLYKLKYINRNVFTNGIQFERLHCVVVVLITTMATLFIGLRIYALHQG